MAAPQSLRLETATIEDIPELTKVWYAGFTDPGLLRFWPDTPGIRKWWDDATRHDMLNRPYQRYVKIVDPNTTDAEGRARIAAFAKWDLSMPSERGARYPAWHPEMPGDEIAAFIQREDDERNRVMGDEKHYFLDTLVTDPVYQKRGAGSMLLKWGCDMADKDGVSAYLDASKAGAPLYKKFGFVDESEPNAGDVASMARRRAA